MPVCELCGKDTQLFPALVEGSELKVCSSCGRFGKVIHRPVSHPKPVQRAVEVAETVVADFALRIRSAREKSGMTQKDFASFLNEKESVVQKLEGGALSPPISMARKLEKLLKIRLVEVEEEAEVASQKKDSGPLTIGDILNVKK